ncbi:MAG TPA: FAD-dependent oxidoreductase [Mycobacteriales bacterium]|nr:FAD-dependent oxidoreductase [Mycobacteriales bacterium]
MKVVVVGAGPVGIVTALGLARDGHEVTVVDRDPGPAADGTWQRKGVMQYLLPHFWRHIVRQCLAEDLPDVWDALVAAGGRPLTPPGAPGFITALAARRSTVETALRGVLAQEPNVRTVTGHAEDVVVDGGRARGVRVDGTTIDADLVVDAGGRASRFAAAHRPPMESSSCGQAYVSRMFRARPGVEPLDSPTPIGAFSDRYLTIVFPQDAGTHSALIVRADDDAALAKVRDDAAYQAVTALIPNLAPWTDLERFEPITPAMAGAGLTNAWGTQLGEDGEPALPGLVWIGDTILTTNPSAGRGVSTGLMQARRLHQLLREHSDVRDVSTALESWAVEQLKPWYDDHVIWDRNLVARYSGGDIDVDGTLSGDIYCDAAAVVPELAPLVPQYFAMMMLPTGWLPFADKVRAVLRDGWRPPLAEGPSYDELALAVERVAA